MRSHAERIGRWVCAVAKRLNEDGFLITTYPTDAIKEGERIWPRYWFGNPQDEYVCEETGEEIILIKDKLGQVIGFEKLNYVVPQPTHLQVAFETVAA
jgi:hypothetical protein